MHTEVITDPLTKDDVRFDLKANIALMQSLAVKKILLLFGFSWGNHIYTDLWKDLPGTPEEIDNLVCEAEKQGFGELANDNLYLTIPQFDVRLQYSHEADIHLSFSVPNAFVQEVLMRWKEKEWLRYGKHKKAVAKILSS